MQDMYNTGWSVWCTYGYCKGRMAVVLRGVLNDGVGRGCLPGYRRSVYVDAGAGRIIMYALSCLKLPPCTYLYTRARIFIYHWV